MMDSQEIVTPVKTGVQASSSLPRNVFIRGRRPGTSSFILDSDFRRNDVIRDFLTFFEADLSTKLRSSIYDLRHTIYDIRTNSLIIYPPKARPGIAHFLWPDPWDRPRSVPLFGFGKARP